MENKDKRNPEALGRRSIDKLTPKMVLASGLVNLMGAPAKIISLWGMICLLAWIIGDALLKIVHELKGSVTLSDIRIRLDAALAVNPETSQASSSWPFACELLVYIAIGTILIAAVALLYAYRERMLRNQIIREMGLQITTLERYFDPRRSTSGLSKSGETHPRDK